MHVLKPGSNILQLAQWIEVIAGDDLFVHALKPGQKPEAEFCAPDTGVKVRAYCNIHGLWKAKA